MSAATISSPRILRRIWFFVAAFEVGGTACGASRARDLPGDPHTRQRTEGGARYRATHATTDAGTAEDLVPEAPEGASPMVTNGQKARVFVRASARALAIDATNVYFGDSDNDALFSAPKAGGEPVRLARHAPVSGAIAVGPESVVWVASPGDTVLQVPLRGGGQPLTLRERGIFSDVAVANGEAFIAEAIGPGGALLRASGSATSRIASFDGAPRALVADATYSYVLTPSKVYRADHAKGEKNVLAVGASFANPQIDDAFIYVQNEVDKVLFISRIPKNGGPMTELARDVRDVPFEVAGGEVLFFDAMKPQVRAVPTSGGAVRVLFEDEAFTTATSVVADATTVYIATGARESGVIVAFARR